MVQVVQVLKTGQGGSSGQDDPGGPGFQCGPGDLSAQPLELTTTATMVGGPKTRQEDQKAGNLKKGGQDRNLLNF